MTPERFGEVTRAYRETENRLPWRLDVRMNEDHARNRLAAGQRTWPCCALGMVAARW